MNTLNRYLMIALVAQLLLLFVVCMSTRPSNETLNNEFLSFDKTQIDEIQIIGTNEKVNINLSNNEWSLSNHHDLPVSSEKVESLFTEIEGISVNFPIATSSSAAKRFKLDESNVNTQVQLKSKGKVVETLYLGSSAGLRKVHTKTKDSDAIYTAEFAMQYAANTPSEWLDKTLLSVKGDIQSIKTDSFELIRSGDSWMTKRDLSENVTLNQQAIESLLETFNTLDIAMWTEPEEAEKIVSQEPIQNTTLIFKEDNLQQEIEFSFYQANDKYYVKRSDNKHMFSVYNYRAEEITSKTFEDFIIETEPETPNEITSQQSKEIEKNVGN